MLLKGQYPRCNFFACKWCKFHIFVSRHATGGCKRFSTQTGWKLGFKIFCTCERHCAINNPYKIYSRGVRRSLLIRSVNKKFCMQKTLRINISINNNKYISTGVCGTVGCSSLCVWYVNPDIQILPLWNLHVCIHSYHQRQLLPEVCFF